MEQIIEELEKECEKVCCNCRHNIRKGEITNIECYCEIDNHYIGYVSCFTDKCRRWAKDENNGKNNDIIKQKGELQNEN